MTKTFGCWRTDDPFREREAKKYDHPIASREYLLELFQKIAKPTMFEEWVEILTLDSDEQLEALRFRLSAMIRDGQIIKNRRQAYCLIDKADLIRGHVVINKEGYGHVKPEKGKKPIYLAARQVAALFHGDQVLVRISGIDRRDKLLGSIVDVLKRNTHELVGRLAIEDGVGIVAPEDLRIPQEIIIPNNKLNGATENKMVVVTITQQPTKKSPPIGAIKEVLGSHMAPGMEIDLAIRSHGLPHEWSDAVVDQVAQFGDEVTAAQKVDRTDLTSLPFVTIDGEDAKDFDDAVYCKKTAKGWKLLVAIADVSSYVSIDSALDEEAQERATSVYFPGRVIPMLPEKLSNGLCSLKPKVDRLALTCEMLINADGEVYRSKFFSAVINSHARLTYKTAFELKPELENPSEPLVKKYGAILGSLASLYEVYAALDRQRIKRGAIAFDTTETQFVFGNDKKIKRIVPVFRNDAHKMIEECMVTANVCAARFLIKNKMPAPFRTHEGLKTNKIEDFKTYLTELGLRLGGGNKPTGKDFSALLQAIEGRPEQHLVQTMLLHSLTQAKYTAKNSGHYGLALESYAHFTSPIRRYPDLLVHRAIKYRLLHSSNKNYNYSLQDCSDQGEFCSTRERRADEAVWDVEGWLKCEYLKDKEGDVYPGVISGVTSFGLFVELKEIYVDGLVHITSLSNDYYHFDPSGHRLVGERSGKKYQLGDEMVIQVARVDLDSRKIDFIPVDQAFPDQDKKTKKPTRQKKKRRKS